METITRIFEFDAAHRVMNERVKCYNLHGHRWKVEVTFSYDHIPLLGYAIDFKEIKRIVGDWIDEHLDHACILNPQDEQLIMLCRNYGWKLYVMGMGYADDKNPTAENLASELFCIIQMLVNTVDLVSIKLYETPNCWVSTSSPSYSASDGFINGVKTWRKDKGDFIYDIRDLDNGKA